MNTVPRFVARAVRPLLRLIDSEPLQAVIAMALVTGIVLPVALVFLMEFGRERAALIRQLETEHEQMVAVLASSLRPPVWNLVPEDAEPIAQAVMLDQRVTALVVHTTIKDPFLEIRRPPPPGASVITRQVPILREKTEIGTVVLSLSTASLDAMITERGWFLLVVTIAQIVAGTLVIYLVLRHKVVRPLAQLDQETQRITAGNWNTALTWNRTDEIGRLGHHLEILRTTLLQQFSEIERQNEGLAESERRYRWLVQRLPAPILITIGTRIFLANQAAAEFFSFPDSDALTDFDYLDLVSEEHVAEAAANLRQVCTQHIAIPLVDRAYIDRHGNQRHAEVAGLPLGPGNAVTGGPPGAVLIMRDVTETRHQRRLVEEKNRLLEAILTHISEGVLLTSPSGRIALISRGFLEIYDLAEASIGPGTTLAEVVRRRLAATAACPPVGPALDAATAAALAAIEAQTVIEDILPDGRVIESRNQKFPDGSLFSIHIDITDRKRTEERLERHRELLEAEVAVRTEALRAAEHRLRAAILASPDGFAFFDSEDRVVIHNQKYIELFSLNPDRPLGGRTIDDILAEIAQVAGYDQTWCVEARAWFDLPSPGLRERRIGDGRWLRIAAEKAHGGGTVVIATDVTAIKQTTSALQTAKDESERAYRSLRATQQTLVNAERLASLGAMVAGVAHEINTPLGVAVTGATLLSEQTRAIAAKVDQGLIRRSEMAQFLKSGQEAADLIFSNLRRAGELIQSFKQVAVDQTSAERRQFDLRRYIEEVLVSLGPLLRKSRHQVQVHCPTEVQIDSFPGALSQILTNLVMNALLHAFPDDQAGRIDITVTEGGTDEIVLRFADNGRGIPAALQGRVFDPFFTTRRGSGGTGLGLHIVFNLVTQTMRGTIALESEEGLGTAFILRFPRFAVTLNDARDVAEAAVDLLGRESFDAAREAFYTHGRFRQGEIYVNVMDSAGRLLIHPPRPELETQAIPALTDAAGRPFVTEILRVAREKAEGWVHYYWQNPVTDRIEPKTSFIKRVPDQDYIVYVGIYRPPGPRPE